MWFDNITIEEMLEGFIDYSNDLAGSYAGSWSTISSLSAEKYEQKQKYEEKIIELNKYKEQVEDLESKLTETLSVWQKKKKRGKKLRLLKHSRIKGIDKQS